MQNKRKDSKGTGKRVDYKLQLYTMHVEECTAARPGRSVVIRESTESLERRISESRGTRVEAKPT